MAVPSVGVAAAVMVYLVDMSFHWFGVYIMQAIHELVGEIEPAIMDFVLFFKVFRGLF